MSTASRNPGHPTFPFLRTKIVGRRRESGEAQALLLRPDVSVLTMTGPPGTGKTRLALHVAEALQDQFPDGVCFVSLAPQSEPSQVPFHIAEALGTPASDDGTAAHRVQQFLRQQHLLLLLDNVEQVIAAAPFIAELVATCPAIKVLATSREPLRLTCEHDFPVPPMALPPSITTPPQDLIQFDAVTLFVQRASAVNPAFALTEDNASDIVEICRGLDGLPLAIELAAARTKLLSPATIRARLINRLMLLTDGPRDQPPRLQSMRDAIAWSYDLLSPDEQEHFRRLSVFVGGFSPEAVGRLVHAAEAGGESPPAASRQERTPFVPAPALFKLGASLVDKSLVQPMADAGDQPRFRLLETIREFGLERLAASGEELAVRDAHALSFLMLAESAHPHLRGPEQAAWFHELETELPNFRVALAWFQECGQHLAALRLANALARFWEARGHFSEGRGLLRDLLHATEQASREAIPELVRARAELWAGTLAHWQGDFDESVALLSSALDRYVAGGDNRGAAHALLRLGQSATFQGNLERAHGLMAESLRRFQNLDDAWGIAMARTGLVNPLIEAGDLEGVERLLAESLPLARAVGDPDLLAMTLINVGWLASWNADDTRAAAALQESHAIFQTIGERRTLPYTLNLLGSLAWRQGDRRRAAGFLSEGLAMSRDLGAQLAIVNSLHAVMNVAFDAKSFALAARLHGAADAVREAIGVPIQPVERASVAAAVDAIRVDLGEATLRSERGTGMARSTDAAIAEALSFLAMFAVPEPCDEPGTRPVAPALSPRELEVLRLVVEGQTNAQIAAALYISHRTVRNHLTSIFAKLKVESRTAATTFALRNGLI